MPFEPTFWAQGAGMPTDRFGTPRVIVGEVSIQTMRPVTGTRGAKTGRSPT